jgi:two-component system, NarL family, response regulator NreC
MRVVKIVLIDNHNVVHEGIKSLLSKRSDLAVVGEALNAWTGLDMAETLKPDLVITDIRMPGMTGIEAAEKIKQRLPQTGIIALSGQFTVITVRQAIRAGIMGFVQKDAHTDDLLKAIDSVLDGKNYFSLKVRQLIASDMHKILHTDNSSCVGDLSSEEVEIVRMLTDGCSVTEIAFQMKKSSKTVDAKRRKIMNKLGLESLAKLTKYAISQGFTSLDY